MNTHEKVLITGASGLLGNNVARELFSRGYQLRVFARKNSNLACLKDIKYELFTGDIQNPDDVFNATKNCMAVIHSAANTNQYPANFKNYEKVNVHATLIMIDAAKKAKVKRFIYVSTANTFGFGSKNNPGNELSEINTIGYSSGYIMSKYLAQQYILREVEKGNLPAIVVNPGFMIGPYDIRPSSGRIVLMGLKKVIVCPPGGKSFIYVKDVAKAICNSLIMGDIGECYLLTNENLSFYEFFKLLNRLTGHASRILITPSILLQSAGLTGSFFELTTKIPVELNYINAKLLCLNHFYSSEKAVKELKMPQTPMLKALPETLEWFVTNGYVKLKQDFEQSESDLIRRRL